MSSQLEAKSSVNDYSALSEENQHHLDALERSEAVDLMEAESLEVSTPLPETAKTQQLCHHCEPMFSTIENLRSLVSKKGYKHNTKKGIKEAADRGCGLCRYMYTHYSAFDNEDQDEHILVSVYRFGKKSKSKLSLFKKISKSAKKNYLLSGFNGNDESTEYPFNERKITRIVFDFPRSSLDFTCLLADQGSPAAAVLQIEPEITSLVRLHASTHDQKDDYIALSYCWGGSQSFTTTTSTLEDCLRGFDSDDLPLTFRDTIFIARSIGIRYVWIDALCIIQDSEVDKAREIERMGEIYKNATVTISAAGATSVNGGLFDHRPKPELLEIPFCLPDKSLSKAYISKIIYVFEHEEPVDKRAWCFQESILSPRLLSFRSTELIWHCQSLKFEPTVSSHYVYLFDTLRAPANVFGRDVAIEMADSFRRAKTWNWIVQDFTGRDLTNPEDRLPAISAIAKEFAFVWNDENIFGVMKSTVERHLSWEVDKFARDRLDKKHGNARNDRAPSWSWVSVDSPVRFQLGIHHINVTCLEIANTPACRKLVLEAKVLSLETHPMNGVQERLFQKFYDSAEDLKAEACTLMLLAEGEGFGPQNFGCLQYFLTLKRLSNGHYQRVGLFQFTRKFKNASRDWFSPANLKILFDSIEMSRVTIV
ncbi:putative het domain protein pin-c1 protein [Botrytis fragariae]|uniref:Putative het domain protein pin-c1 protein n=1 Tax=Botrytis fragariae TaxID=1964551 RepID=A0A8H6AXW8_9HELO|nr:putative het domain protein pin-c1 protein [Botrytis fragariae]KAF5875668.1 putative het domain protein pin-c1 protein [Botrytis fragariae]